MLEKKHTVSVAVNNHYELADIQDLRISELIADHWLSAINTAFDMSKNIILDAQATK